jgi:hypothetical protein
MADNPLTTKFVNKQLSFVKDRAAEAAVEKPLTIEYTNLLHLYQAPNAPQVRAFRQMHKGNKVFLKRARTLDALFLTQKVSKFK